MKRERVWMTLPVLLVLVACVLTPVTPPEDDFFTPPPITADTLVGLQSEDFDLPGWPVALLWPQADRLLVVTNESEEALQMWELLLFPLRSAAGSPVQVGGLGPVMAFAPDGSSMALPAGDVLSLVRLDGSPLYTLSSPALYGAHYDASGDFLVTTSQVEWQALVWDTTTGLQLAGLTGFETAAPVYGVLLSPGGSWVVWKARATLAVQAVQSGQFTAQMGYRDFVLDVEFLPDASRMVVLVEGRWLVLDLATGEELQSCPAQEAFDLAVSPDGRLLVGAAPGQVLFWALDSCALLGSQPGQADRLGFSPDGRALAGVLAGETTVRVWSVR